MIYIYTHTALTIRADQSHAADVCRVAGSIDSSHVPAHGGSHQVKRFPVQVDVLHKLQRTITVFFSGANRSLTNESTHDWLYIRVPGESVWPAREWSSHRCWCVSSPRGRACPHTRCADALVGTGEHDGDRSFTHTHELTGQGSFTVPRITLTLTTVSQVSLWAENPWSIRMDGLVPGFPLEA